MWQGYVVTGPSCGPLLILSPRCTVPGTTPVGKGYLATWPTCGPVLILSPALKGTGPPWREGSCCHPAHLWSLSDFTPGF